MNCDESVTILSGLRYMIGRQSYGVGCVIDHIKSKKNELTDSNKRVIERDIIDYIKEHPDCYSKDEWINLIDFIK